MYFVIVASDLLLRPPYVAKPQEISWSASPQKDASGIGPLGIIYLRPHAKYSSELAEGALSPEAGAAPEIEVTPAMIEAGAAALWEFETTVQSKRLVLEVYSAMVRAAILQPGAPAQEAPGQPLKVRLS